MGSVAAQTTALFSLLLPVVGVASIPFVGLLLDRTHLSTSFFVINLLGILFGIFSYAGARGCGGPVVQCRALIGWRPRRSPARASCIQSFTVQYVSIVLLVVLRPLFYSAVSVYCADMYAPA